MAKLLDMDPADYRQMRNLVDDLRETAIKLQTLLQEKGGTVDSEWFESTLADFFDETLPNLKKLP